ncbi:MAG: hypothetical protein ABIH76_00915 [Candidatus Bathyarchaeota archaeon]
MFNNIQLTNEAREYVAKRGLANPSILITIDFRAIPNPCAPGRTCSTGKCGGTTAANIIASTAQGFVHPPIQVKVAETEKTMEDYAKIQTNYGIPALLPVCIAELLEEEGSALTIDVSGSWRGKELKLLGLPPLNIYVDSGGNLTGVRLREKVVKKPGYICGYCGVWLAPPETSRDALKEIRKKHLTQIHGTDLPY